jgi:hypothetical protein
MTIYQRMATTSNRLLDQYGQLVTLTRLTPGAYDPATGAAIVVNTTQQGIGAVFDYGNRDIDGTVIKTGDKQLILSAIGLVLPLVGDQVTVGLTVYKITNVKALSPAGTLVIAECNIRGG